MSKLILASILALASAWAADVSGTWQITVETNQGTGTPTMVLAQKGEEITGTFNSQILGQAKITGTVKGNAAQIQLRWRPGE